jgi:sulfatase maturation enzyme AslB (radical SAM superfamily)
MKVVLNLTHRCNLFCKYCYSGRKIIKDMSLTIARKIVDFAIDITPPEQKIGFSFTDHHPVVFRIKVPSQDDD